MSATSSTASLRLDDEIRPTVEKLQAETDRLMGLAREVYIPSTVADTVIGEKLPVPLQLQLYVTSALVTLSSAFCQKKLANEPIPDRLREQLARVEVYKRKLREHGINIDSSSTSTSASDRRRQRDNGDDGAEPAAADIGSAAATAGTTAARTKKVDPKAVANVAAMAASKVRKQV